MDTCAICRKVFAKGDRIVANSMETFVFKSATVLDTVNPAKVSREELLESRKEHKKTEMATTFITYDGGRLDGRYFSQKHVECVFPSTNRHVLFSKNPIQKHSIRYQRQAKVK